MMCLATVSNRLSLYLTVALLLTLSATAVANEGFPGREKYPEVPYISLDDLYQGYQEDKYTIVDARTHFEYNVIQIKGAINVPVSEEAFEKNIKAVAKETDKPIVFYCNGRRCMKSYKAAIKSKLPNVIAYDAGIFEWAAKYPDATVLLGESPANPDDLISTEKLKAHFLPLAEFEKKIPNSVLIDVRDMNQRRGNGLFLLADKSVPLDNARRLKRYIQKAIKEDKTLLAYDQAGKQVRWLQYHLEKNGVKDYYFMKGGAKYYSYE